MTDFVSPKAKIDGYFEDGAVILGATVIGSGTLIGKDVIVGYPVEKTIKSPTFSPSFNIKEFNAVSKGAKIGRDCIIRSGTIIYENASLSDHVRTGHNALIREDTVIGEDTLIGSSVTLDGTVKIGRRVKIQSNAYLPHLTVIEDDVFIAPNVCFTNDPYPDSHCLIGTRVEENAVICANATLIAGVKIGKDAVVGAGALVSKDVAPGSVVLGTPARHYMTRQEFEEKKEIWKKSQTAKNQ